MDNQYLYTDQEYDDEIDGGELYNLRARYYKPDIGRFISEDPEVSNTCGSLTKHNMFCCCITDEYAFVFRYDPLLLNPYQYVANNPINLIDPTGRLPRYLCLPIAILKAWGKTAGKKADEALKHCVYSCEIARECDPFLGVAAGTAKEIIDYIGFKTKRWGGTPSLADMGKNMAGIDCSNEPDPCNPDELMDCLECCKKKLGKQ